MRFLRASTIALLTLGCVIGTSTLIYLFTLQSTVMNRNVVKGWLRDSAIYTHNPIGTILNSVPTAPAEPATQFGIQPEAAKAALVASFPPEFIQTHTETTIDRAYDWMEGKADTFEVSIPVNEQRETFIQQLAKSVEPQVAALPVCTQALAVSGAACRPASISVPQLATQLTSQSVAASSTLTQPLTLDSLTTAPASSASPAAPTSAPATLLNTLPATYSLLRTLMVVLPVLLVLSVALIFRLSPAAQRTTALLHLTRRILFGTIFTFVIALVLLWLTKTQDLTLPPLVTSPSTATLELFMPLLRLAASDLALWLTIYSGVVCLVCVGIWIGLSNWRHRSREQALLASVTPVMSQPTATESRESQN